MNAYDNLKVYYGDIHNHCAVGYGHGSIEDAFHNARLQLDFACVTVHGHWGDLPKREEHLAPIVDFHQHGFEVTRQMWSHVIETVHANHEPNKFVTFLGYEWHSLEYGDHNIYFKQPDGHIIRVEHLNDLRQELQQLKQRGIDCMLLPHHIGYKQGYRGINWSTFTEDVSPIVEIMSMHGCSESPNAPFPYLHTMGPRDGNSTYQHGLSQGHIVGVMGSTDHHSAHPGSYGHGRMAVWSTNLTRDGIWNAIQQRRTVALTGDNISLQFSVNDAPIGSVLPATKDRQIKASVVGGSSIDYIDLVHNNRVIYRWNGFQAKPSGTPDRVKILIELGWCGKNENVEWNVSLDIHHGELISVEPRFRGHEILSPQSTEEDSYAFSSLEHHTNTINFQTCTWGNPTTTTSSTQGVCLEIDCHENTFLQGTINGNSVKVKVIDLLSGPQSVYLGAFRTPVCYFHRAIPQWEYIADFDYDHITDVCQRDWYYIRVRQYNGQWAWSSPIWIERD